MRDYFTIAGVLASIAAAIFGVWHARRESQKAVAAAAVAAAVEQAVREERLKSMEKQIGELEVELNGVRAGHESACPECTTALVTSPRPRRRSRPRLPCSSIATSGRTISGHRELGRRRCEMDPDAAHPDYQPPDLEPGWDGKWERMVRKKPSAITVARLAESHGYLVCCERWGWLSPRTIGSLIRAGKWQIERQQA